MIPNFSYITYDLRKWRYILCCAMVHIYLINGCLCIFSPEHVQHDSSTRVAQQSTKSCKQQRVVLTQPLRSDIDCQVRHFHSAQPSFRLGRQNFCGWKHLTNVPSSSKRSVGFYFFKKKLFFSKHRWLKIQSKPRKMFAATLQPPWPSRPKKFLRMQ